MEQNKQFAPLQKPQSQLSGAQTQVRVRPMKPQILQGLKNSSLTEKQMHAFSKESLLKPAMRMPEPNKQALVEESKEPLMKGSLYKTPQS